MKLWLPLIIAVTLPCLALACVTLAVERESVRVAACTQKEGKIIWGNCVRVIP